MPTPIAITDELKKEWNDARHKITSARKKVQTLHLENRHHSLILLSNPMSFYDGTLKKYTTSDYPTKFTNAIKEFIDAKKEWIDIERRTEGQITAALGCPTCLHHETRQSFTELSLCVTQDVDGIYEREWTLPADELNLKVKNNNLDWLHWLLFVSIITCMISHWIK